MLPEVPLFSSMINLQKSESKNLIAFYFSQKVFIYSINYLNVTGATCIDSSPSHFVPFQRFRFLKYVEFVFVIVVCYFQGITNIPHCIERRY